MSGKISGVVLIIRGCRGTARGQGGVGIGGVFLWAVGDAPEQLLSWQGLPRYIDGW